MDMKSYSVRLDNKLFNILETKAKQQEIKLSRYIRSLIEKGLVIDSQINQPGFGVGDGLDLPDDTFKVNLAELSVQSLVLTRKLLRARMRSEARAEETIRQAEQLAHDYVVKLMEESKRRERI